MTVTLNWLEHNINFGEPSVVQFELKGIHLYRLLELLDIQGDRIRRDTVGIVTIQFEGLTDDDQRDYRSGGTGDRVHDSPQHDLGFLDQHKTDGEDL